MDVFNSKLFLLEALIFIFLLYFPINKRSRFGFHTELFIDKYIPFIPIFIISYVGSYFLGIIFIIIAFTRPIVEFQQFIFALSLAAIVSYVIYIFFPTSMIRPEIKKIGFPYSLIKLIYKIDKPHNVFPSGHVFYTTIFLLFFSGWYPDLKFLFLLIAVLLYLSTVFVKQHYVSNIISGVILGYLSYLISLTVIN